MRGTIMRVAAIAFAALAPYSEPPRAYLTVPTRICYGKRATGAAAAQRAARRRRNLRARAPK